ncbi:hypothetical protein BH09PAT4_BH09PAT4_06420 [soil metagenome]
MSISYEAHPLNHAGEPEVTVVVRVPSNCSEKQRNTLLLDAEDEVQQRERIAGIMPLERVVFSAHDENVTPKFAKP